MRAWYRAAFVAVWMDVPDRWHGSHVPVVTVQRLRSLVNAGLMVLGVALAMMAVILTVAAPASAAGTTSSTPILAAGAGMGDKPSAAVGALQRRLRLRGYDLGAPGVDGRFGPLTETAVRRLQFDHGLVADGIVGTRMRKLLRLGHRAKRPSARHPRAAHRPRAHPGRIAAGPRVPEPAPTPRRADGGQGGSPVSSLLLGAGALAALCMALASSAATRRRPPSTPIVAVAAGERPVQMPGDDDQAGPHGDRPAGGRPAPLEPGEQVIGYVTLPADARDHRVDGRAEAIVTACGRGQWELLNVVTDRETGRGLARPGLNYALRQIAERKVRGLVVGDMRRLTRSVIDLGALMEWFRDADAVLIALDLDIDTSTPAGHEAAGTLIRLGDSEREHRARRTRAGMADVRANGRHIGPLAVRDRPELADRITDMRATGMTMQAIADRLNSERVPTLRGGTMWRPSSVQAALGYHRPGSRRPRDQLPRVEEASLP
jgi:DNA invertase Pin-like site-specific DNA recombinase